MSTQRIRVAFLALCLLFATASFLSAGGAGDQPTVSPFQPAFLSAAPAGASCQLKAGVGGGGNCDTDADCPSGSYCYHDPIALVPYCVAGSGGASFEF